MEHPANPGLSPPNFLGVLVPTMAGVPLPVPVPAAASVPLTIFCRRAADGTINQFKYGATQPAAEWRSPSMNIGTTTKAPPAPELFGPGLMTEKHFHLKYDDSICPMEKTASEKKAAKEAKKVETARRTALSEENRQEEDRTKAMDKLEKLRDINVARQKARVCRAACGFGISFDVSTLVKVTEPFGPEYMLGGVEVTLLSAGNDILLEVLPDDGIFTAEEWFMYVPNQIPLLGDTLKYYKSNSLLSMYMGKSNDFVNLLPPEKEGTRYYSLDGNAQEAVKLFSKCIKYGPFEGDEGSGYKEIDNVTELLGPYVQVDTDADGTTVLWKEKEIELSPVAFALYRRNWSVMHFAITEFNKLLPSRCPKGSAGCDDGVHMSGRAPLAAWPAPSLA